MQGNECVYPQCGGACKESIFTFEMAGILVLILLINISNGRENLLRVSKNYNFDQELKQYCMYYERQLLPSRHTDK